MKPIQLFACVVIFATPVLGCFDRIPKSPSENVVQPEGNGQASPGSDSAAAEVSTMAPEASNPPASSPEKVAVIDGDRYPKVTAVKTKPLKNNGWQFNVTLSSPYDSPQRYADAWRVLDGQDQELGIRILGHDHASEQPFTRSRVIEVPAGTTTVFVEGRDQANGWSGQRFEFKLP